MIRRRKKTSCTMYTTYIEKKKWIELNKISPEPQLDRERRTEWKREEKEEKEEFIYR